MELRKSRRLSRETAIQFLYSADIQSSLRANGYDIPRLTVVEAISHIMEMSKNTEDETVEYAVDAVMTVLDNLSSIDALIEKHLVNWTFDDLAILDRNILRLCIAEMLYFELTPAVAINEAVDIGKKFSGKQTGKFINGVLDKIAKEHQAVAAAAIEPIPEVPEQQGEEKV